MKFTLCTLYLSHQLEIYDPVDPSQGTLEPNKEKVTEFASLPRFEIIRAKALRINIIYRVLLLQHD